MALKILILLFPLFGGVVVAAGLALRRQRSGPDHPACGKCGYNVTGLPSLNCPECGSDLRIVGIMTPGQRRRSGPGLLIFLWTLILPIPLLLVAALAMATILPNSYESQQRRVIFCQDSALATTITATRIGRQVLWGGWQGNANAPVTNMTLSFTTPNGQAMIDVNLPDKRYQYTLGSKLSKGETFDSTALLQCLSDGGFDATNSVVVEDAGYILACIDEIPAANNKFTYFAQGNGRAGITAHPSFFFTNVRPVGWAMVGMLAIAVAIWWSGVVWILRRHRRLAVPVAV